MHAVVNHLPIRTDADWADIAAKFEKFATETRAANPGVRDALLVRAGDTEAIFIGLFHDAETMRHVSSDIAAPWFAANIRPYLAGPAARTVGEVIAGTV